MSAAKKTAGPSSARVAANVRRLRTEQQISTYELAKLLADAGWPIGAGGITRIEQGERRVDVDDLVALALVFGVSPNVLLMPRSRARLVQLQAEVELAPNSVTNLGNAWGWMTGEKLLPRGRPGVTLHDEAEFVLDNRPHRFALGFAGERGASLATWQREMDGAVGGALAGRFTPWQIRTMFEQSLVTALNEHADAPAPADWSAPAQEFAGDEPLPDRTLEEIAADGMLGDDPDGAGYEPGARGGARG